MRILIADNREKVRLALRLLLEQRRDSVVVGEVANGQDLITHAISKRPDLLLLDWDLPDLENDTLIPELLLECPDLHVIALSSHSEDRPAALNAGVHDFVSKTDPPEILMQAIDHYLESVALDPPRLAL
jgi:DNA-binding NarL/FixJ family response regulator